MGQCYSVTAKLRFRDSDPNLFCKIVQDEIAQLSDYATFRQDCDLTTPEGCFEVLTRNSDCEGEVWLADFDASYGWEGIMCEVFFKAARGLANDSYINIDVWEGEGMSHSIRIEDGRVSHIVAEVADSYEIDDDEEDFNG